ncbi:ABC transporter permease [Sorangium sp. So ce448]|uniref:ABC transporter permease n=1 Tax=Sorangium sp. So ce448 TaxID=3133314 RepID=UPI003F5E7BE6
MSSARIYAVEALHELRAGLRTSLVPLMFVGLVGYLFIMLSSAEYLRDMGGADVARNSPHVVFLMTSGQSFWLIFAWAWIFAQVVTRDRAAGLHELVLSAPVSLRGLLISRYIGAVGLACILGSASSLGFLLVPGLAALGVFPREAVGPTPIVAIASSWALFVVPSAIGLGALYLTAALRTRSTAGPFAVAAVVILIWMVAMIVLRGGDLHTDIATVVDVSGFGEAEAQTKRWTPHEKATAQLAMTAPLLVNRLLWSLVPLAILAFALARHGRESLVLGRPGKPSPSGEATSRAAAPAAPAVAALPPITAPSWLRATLSEARWHLSLTTRGWAFRTAVALWTLMNVAGAFYHVIGHAEGPLVPRPALLAPFLIRLCYVFSVFAVAGFVGALARRDQQSGFDEMIDATLAPLGTRVVGRAVAALLLTAVMALAPTLSAWIVTGLTLPSSFEPWNALLVNALVAAPALLELGAITFLVHALVRSPGTGYAASMLAAFIALVNHEIDIVSYPPAQLGIPVHVALSELSGWSPWLLPVLEMGVLKLSCVGLAVALAWLAYPRGTALRRIDRWRGAARQLAQGAGALAALSLFAIACSSTILHEQIVVQSGFASKSEENAADAAWEARFWPEASAFSVEGGEVEAKIAPSARTAHVRWKLRGVRASAAKLHGSLRTGMDIDGAQVDGSPREVVTASEHFMVDLGSCAQSGCDVELEIRIASPRWFAEGQAPWLDGSGVWARAADLVPRLGYDGERALRSPSTRRALGLAERPGALDRNALVPALAVAPAGLWRWSVSFSDQGVSTPVEGSTTQGLDFAVAWLPRGAEPRQLRQEGVTAWHGPSRADTAREVLEDVQTMSACVQARLGAIPEVTTVVQAPRDLGEIRAHGAVLWLPEGDGWDVAASGAGRLKRRAAVAEALAARSLADRADLRAEPGARWLINGVAGWIGLECVRRSDGGDAWLALLDRRSDDVADALGALDAPVSGLADDGAASWVMAYAPLETLAWAQAVGDAEALHAATRVADMVRSGEPVRGALARAAGPIMADRLLGPPSASDVTVAIADGGALEVRGERSRWEGGGWRPVSSSFEIVQRFHDEETPARVTRVPARLESDAQFVVFDAWPSFERSPRDNAWKAGRH